MTANSDQLSANSESSFVGTVSESIRTHLSERLKSPFAGAFVFSWIAVNWKDILIIFLSKKDVEDRISLISSHIDQYSIIWHPLWLAATITFGFYLCSVAFLVFFECYSTAKEWAQRRFDPVRWVPPATYINFKSRTRSEIADLTQMAADNLSQVDAERKKAIELQTLNLKLQEELTRERVQLQHVTSEVATQATRATAAIEANASLSTKADKLSSDNLILLSLVRNFIYALAYEDRSTTTLQRPAPERDLDVWRSVLSAQMKLRENIPSELLISKLTDESIGKYSTIKYSLLPVSPKLQSKLLKDISASGLDSEFRVIGDLDRVVNNAEDTMYKYSLDRPDVFRFSTDYLTKSLGYLVPKFREAHGFSGDTLVAFEKYSKQPGFRT